MPVLLPIERIADPVSQSQRVAVIMNFVVAKSRIGLVLLSRVGEQCESEAVF